jgi:hypothetical protein
LEGIPTIRESLKLLRGANFVESIDGRYGVVGSVLRWIAWSFRSGMFIHPGLIEFALRPFLLKKKHVIIHGKWMQELMDGGVGFAEFKEYADSKSATWAWCWDAIHPTHICALQKIDENWIHQDTSRHFCVLPQNLLEEIDKHCDFSTERTPEGIQEDHFSCFARTLVSVRSGTSCLWFADPGFNMVKFNRILRMCYNDWVENKYDEAQSYYQQKKDPCWNFILKELDTVKEAMCLSLGDGQYERDMPQKIFFHTFVTQRRDLYNVALANALKTDGWVILSKSDVEFACEGKFVEKCTASAANAKGHRVIIPLDQYPNFEGPLVNFGQQVADGPQICFYTYLFVGLGLQLQLRFDCASIIGLNQVDQRIHSDWSSREVLCFHMSYFFYSSSPLWSPQNMEASPSP